ncbi:hypothetical protein DRP53_08450 [candidate division WOR-3 bacterium]|uniref:Thioredoxin domain-containing protein n=1 Tax=candidate division WOR-3 bacterium TaxID=2052148 RepID=A0A660SFM1_UNCW3|nr:MAG: hypothetical protein DRP53_08450 [candidate division WOR-3 bacterium]
MSRLLPLLLPLLLFAQSEFTEAPSFELESIDGEIVSLDSLLKRGPVYMSFWALWCKQCIKELDAFLPYYNEFRKRGLIGLAISEDGARFKARVKSFAKSHRWTYITLYDPDGEVKELFNVRAIPVTFIITQDKRIVFEHQGYKKGDELHLKDTLEVLLPEADTTKEGGCGE